jgi:hypothetical protein
VQITVIYIESRQESFNNDPAITSIGLRCPWKMSIPAIFNCEELEVGQAV